VRVVLSKSVNSPLYEQIREQVAAAILSGELESGAALPSVRALARDLRISVITTARAYAELAAEGFITTVASKGTFVQPVDSELVREQRMRQVEADLQAALDGARMAGLSRDGLVEVLDALIQAELQDKVE
jgi:GntR family transcriptional regulator